MNPPFLKLEGVGLKHRGRFILEDVSLEVSKGQMVGILGTNGAGKTTLLKVCCGLARPACGRVFMEGVDIYSKSLWSRTNNRKRIGYLPQNSEYNSNLPLTVREIVSMGRVSVKGLLSGCGEEDRRIVDYWIDRLGLSPIAGQTFRSLSGGQQQITLIARAMAQQAQLLILDEPGANLDLKVKNQLIRIIDQLYSQLGLTVMIVSHETALLPGSCSKVVVMDTGRIVFTGEPRQVFALGILEKIFGCPAGTGDRPADTGEGIL